MLEKTSFTTLLCISLLATAGITWLVVIAKGRPYRGAVLFTGVMASTSLAINSAMKYSIGWIIPAVVAALFLVSLVLYFWTQTQKKTTDRV